MDINKKIFILRGLPGVGKSTLASYLATNLAPKKGEGKGAIILSSDDFFIASNGKYIFDDNKIVEAHKWNFKRFKEAIERELSPIIIDNSNYKKYHYYQYVDYAQRKNYSVAVIVIPHNDVSDKELEERTPHGIKRRTIEKMRRNFEWEI